MLEEILQPEDCISCKKCCKFDSDELVDAPVVTSEIKDLILRTVDGNVHFSRRGKMWQINLIKMDGIDKYVCPILDPNSGCRLGEDRPFDCKTWPFYIMDFKGQIVITLSPSCPVVNERSVQELREYVKENLSDFMLGETRSDPDLITEYHDDATILAVLGPKTELLSK